MAQGRDSWAGSTPFPGTSADTWSRIPQVELDPAGLAARRIVTFDKTSPAHVPFDMLRTRILRAFRGNGWRSVGITSPAPGCGKSLTCLNLAFSFARQPNCRTLLLDLDLRQPSLAKTLGIRPPHCVSDVITGEVAPEEGLIAFGRTLVAGLALGPIPHSAELLQDEAVADSLRGVVARLDPTVVIVDLPPLLASDDAAAFLGQVDGALLVAAEGETSLDDIETCSREISQLTHDLGIVVNKSDVAPRSYTGYWGYYGYGE